MYYQPNNISAQLTQTGTEPIALTDAKNFLRIDDTNDDALVTALIQSARSTAEKWLNRLIVQTTVVLTLDFFPACEIKLPYGPVQSVTSIQVTDNAGNQTAWDPGNYIVDAASARIVYSPTVVFPSTYQSINAVQVTYVAGYGLLTDVTGVPAGIVQGCRQLIAATFENRETAVAVPPLVCALLLPFRKMVI